MGQAGVSRGYAAVLQQWELGTRRHGFLPAKQGFSLQILIGIIVCAFGWFFGSCWCVPKRLRIGVQYLAHRVSAI